MKHKMSVHMKAKICLINVNTQQKRNLTLNLKKHKMSEHLGLKY